MLIDLAFYVGERQIADGKWPFVPFPGMTLRLELPAGAEVFKVEGAEGMGVHAARSRSTGPTPNLLCRGVRVKLAPVAAVPDSPADWGLR